MPTPTGKPQVGEWILTKEGDQGLVVRRGTGEMYTLWVKWNGSRSVTMITEFPWWMKRNKWRVASKPADTGVL